MLKEMFKKTKYISLDPYPTVERRINSDSKVPNADMHDRRGGSTRSNNINNIVYDESVDKSPFIPDGAWIKCETCGETLFHEDVSKSLNCCPKCGVHFRISAISRIQMMLDDESFVEWDKHKSTKNVLDFPGYEDKIKKLQLKMGILDAVITGKGTIEGNSCAVAIMDSGFLMGSMGQVVGEKITRAVEKATSEKLPIIIFCTSGGARMQEGIVSLMQMAKTSGALKRHSEAGLLYISVLTDPTTGGVTASFAMLGDIILAEPGALIGFAGPRVIEQTIKQRLPEGFQRAEFLMEKGFVDAIVVRKDMKVELGKILSFHKNKVDITSISIHESNKRMEDLRENQGLEPWDRVQLARKANRYTALDYIEQIFDDFTEFHGDRLYGDDNAIVAGIAYYKGIPVTIIAEQKGRNTKDNIKRNFGMPNPEGYRKALRLMKQAEKFKRPIICFVDTPGAYCGLGAEERGQGEAIARNLMEMSDLKVPVLSIIIGEGGSGGALALAVANEVWMLENSIYSILSPEGFASILWKDSNRAKEAAGIMKITANDLLEIGIVDKVIQESAEGFETNPCDMIDQMRFEMGMFLSRMLSLTETEIADQRYEKFRKSY